MSALRNRVRISPKTWRQLARAAWAARNRAHLHGRTGVGAAALARNGKIHAGCNIEHRFRCHDIHAEISALAGLISAGGGGACAILVVSDKTKFTPCGSCMDWIFELGGPNCVVAYQSKKSTIKIFEARDLMPNYPH